jgi:hypothetical protein
MWVLGTLPVSLTETVGTNKFYDYTNNYLIHPNLSYNQNKSRLNLLDIRIYANIQDQKLCMT